MRYAYGLTSALLVGGAAISLATGQPAGAQVAQNAETQMRGMTPRAGAPETFADLTEQLQPAVVNISTRQTVEVRQNNPFAGTPFADMFNNRRGGGGSEPQTREGRSLGSGFMISADGYLVTNNHVISANDRARVEEILVTFPDGEEYEATVVGADPDSDLAVLKISRSRPFPFVSFGDSEDARVGDWVIAIGNPFGLGGTVTSGIISSVLRNTGSGTAYDRYLQTDASINSGNSGGPLFDMQGNVIGINNAIISPTGGNVGIGFAIPAEIASPIVDQLREGQSIERGYLGVSIQPVSEDLADSLGLEKNRGEIVQFVVPGQAAGRAGIEAGDIVVTVNGKEVTSRQSLSYLVSNVKPGETIPLQVLRDGKRRSVNVTVGQRPNAEELAQQQMFNQDSDEPEMPEDSGDGPLEEKLGLRVFTMTPSIAGQLGIDEDTQGLVIGAVNGNSDAARKGLRRGDIILTANYREVTQIADLESEIDTAQQAGREAVLLRVKQRGAPARYVAVRFR